MVNPPGDGDSARTLLERPATEAISESSSSWGEAYTTPPDTTWRPNEPGHDFDRRYERRGPLARGGMGELEIFRDRRIGREIVAKLLPRERNDDQDYRTRFTREACVQGQLEHPSIVPVHEAGTTPDGQLYFTMKRVRGRTLLEILRALRDNDPETTAKFSRRKLLAAFDTICLTVAFAHERGIIHRDLKPANIMLGDFGETYLLDWGLAKPLVPDAITDPSAAAIVPTRGGAIVGTLGYMAPEQIGAPDSVTRAVDIYALGAILFEILTLEKLHPHTDHQALINSTLSRVEAHPSVRAPEREVPPELELICVRATELEAHKRFESAREMHEAIDRYLDGDRDLSLRRDMAQKHAERAESLAKEASSVAPAEEAPVRSRAIREVGKALAFDPGNARSMRVLVRMLLEPPRLMPKETAEELDRSTDRWLRDTDRSVAVAYASCMLSLPLVIAMGVRSWPLVIAVYALFAVLSLASLGAATAELRRPWWIYPRMIASVLLIVIVGRMFGPLFFIPSLIVANAAGAMFSPRPQVRKFTVLISALALLIAPAMEWIGLVGASYAFRDGAMCVLPNMVNLEAHTAVPWLLATNIGLLLVASMHASRTRASLRDAEEKAHLYNWHLRQLVITR